MVLSQKIADSWELQLCGFASILITAHFITVALHTCCSTLIECCSTLIESSGPLCMVECNFGSVLMERRLTSQLILNRLRDLHLTEPDSNTVLFQSVIKLQCVSQSQGFSCHWAIPLSAMTVSSAFSVLLVLA